MQRVRTDEEGWWWVKWDSEAIERRNGSTVG